MLRAGDAIAARVAGVDFAPLLARVQRRLGWSADYSARVLIEYKRFMELKCALRDFSADKLTPPLAVDEMWHLHVLDTKRYKTDCQEMAGDLAFIHHDADGDADADARAERIRTVRMAYEARFGATPPTPIWDFEKPVIKQEEGSGGAPARGTKRAAEAPMEPPSETFTIKLRDLTGEEFPFKVKNTTPIEKICLAFAQQKDVNVASLRFLLRGERIPVEGPSTVGSVGLEAGDVIDVMLEIRGC